MREHPFSHCVVRVYDDRVETTHLEDGSVSVMRPPLDDQTYRDVALWAGYRDPWRYAVDHELAHAVVADELGWPCSWSVWASAHGVAHRSDGSPRSMSRAAAYDEHLTNHLQRYMQTGLEDDLGMLRRAFRERLDSVTLRLADCAERQRHG